MLIKASAAIGEPIHRKDIHIISWARAYQSAILGPNVLLFSTTRTKERETMFKWAGPIAEDNTVVWAKKSSGIPKFNDISTTTYKIIVVRDDVADQLVVEAGVLNSNIARANRLEAAVKMLAHSRAPLLAYDKVAFLKIMSSTGGNPDDYEIVNTIASSKVYFAFSKDVDDEIVNKLQKGIDLLRK